MNPDLEDELEAINSIYGPSTIDPSSASETNTYVLQIPQEPSLPPLALRISFPSSYPEQPPSILSIHTETARGSGAAQIQLARDTLEKAYTPNAVVLFDYIEALRLVLPSSVSLTRQANRPPSLNPPHEHLHDYDSTRMYRCIFYFHHIYSSKKIKHLHDLAQTYRLAGVMKTSRPGFLFAQTLPHTASSTKELTPEEIEGKNKSEHDNGERLQAFTKEVKGMRWQEARVVYFEAMATEPTKGPTKILREESKKIAIQRQAKEDAARPGFIQVENMSDFSAWMHDRGLSDILKEGVLR